MRGSSRNSRTRGGRGDSASSNTTSSSVSSLRHSSKIPLTQAQLNRAAATGDAGGGGGGAAMMAVDSKTPDIKPTPTTASFTTTATATTAQSTTPLLLADTLRHWRQEALNNQLYGSAVFWGNKVACMTGDSNDFYWLANSYFKKGQYQNAERILIQNNIIYKNLSCQYLAALCLSKMDKWDSVIEVLSVNIQGGTGSSAPNITTLATNNSGDIQLSSSCIYLRGVAYLRKNNFDLAKSNLILALTALQLLLENHMLSSVEEQELLNTLDYMNQLGSHGDFVKALYSTKLKKYGRAKEIEQETQKLETEYHLTNNVDILIARAESYFVQCNYKKCIQVTFRILELDPFNFKIIPTHVSCLVELNLKHKLFYLAHKLVDEFPSEAISWFAVGSYYAMIQKHAESRRYFSKSSTINPSFGPAWLGFGHSFSVEGEHDQAILAYSTAGKLMRGIHLPKLYIGMEHSRLKNYTLAEEFLKAAQDICPDDPLLENELGYLYYKRKQFCVFKKADSGYFFKNNNHYYNRRFETAVSHFQRSLSLSEADESKAALWESTWCNLGHSYRQLRQYEKACKYFDLVLSVNPNSAAAYTTLGVIYHLDGKISEAIVKYHQALAIVPDDSVTLEMLEQALGMKSSSSASSTEESGILTSSSSSTPTTDPTAGLNINTLVSPKRKQKQTKDLMHLSAADNSIETLISSLPVEFHQVSASAIANGGVSSSTSGSPAVASGGGGVGGTSSFDDDRFIPEKLRAVMKANQDALNSHLIGDEDEEEAADDDEEGNDLREQGEEDDGEEMELEDADEDGGDATINNSLLLTRLRSSVRQTPASNTSSSAAAARSSRMDNTPVTAANRAPGVNDHQNPPPRRSGRTLHLAQESTDDDAEEQEMDLDSD